MRMQYSEYNKKFPYMRLLILPSIRHIEQDKKLNEHSSGRKNGEEMNEWRKRSKKENNWYKRDGSESVNLLAATPGAQLQRKYQQEVKR